MAKEVLISRTEVEAIYKRHAKTVYRVCFAYMKNTADTDDATAETFVRLIKSSMQFESSEHEKAWLIKTAANICKDMLKHSSRKNESLDAYTECFSKDESIYNDEVLSAVLELPINCKTAVYMFYYEGYSCPEIAKHLNKPQPTVRFYLQQARKLLKKRLGDDYE